MGVSFCVESRIHRAIINCERSEGVSERATKCRFRCFSLTFVVGGDVRCSLDPYLSETVRPPFRPGLHPRRGSEGRPEAADCVPDSTFRAPPPAIRGGATHEHDHRVRPLGYRRRDEGRARYFRIRRLGYIIHRRKRKIFDSSSAHEGEKEDEEETATDFSYLPGIGC